jgi:hypothetical protein
MNKRYLIDQLGFDPRENVRRALAAEVSINLTL